MDLYDATQQVVGLILNLIVAVIAIAAFVSLPVILVTDLVKRRRFGIRTLLIAMTLLAIFLGLGAISHK